MQQKNFLLFVVLSCAVVLGWMQIQMRIWPPKRRPAVEEPEMVKIEPAQWLLLSAQMDAVAGQGAGLPGLGGACRIGTEIMLADWTAAQRRIVLAKAAPKPPPPPPKKEAGAVVKLQTITLGDDGSAFNLKVVLTNEGAGVETLVLNKFAQADRWGRPANPPENLHLIPGPGPSELLYHYAPPVDATPSVPPEQALAETRWKVIKANYRPTDPVHEAVFETDLDPPGVRITKTYTLERETYHVGLTLRIERKPGATGNVPFRYQLAGAHGLPIEGEWYTPIFRNAMIGIDAKGNVWRTLQAGQSIGKGGGHEERRGENTIRYAGVATQYFASIVVIDNQQEPDQKQNFVEIAQPAVEGPPNAAKPFLDDITVRLISEPMELKPGVPVVHKYLLYNGPVKVKLLGDVEGGSSLSVSPEVLDRYTGPGQLGLNTLTDSSNVSWVPGFWTLILVTCTNLMHGLLWFLHRYIMPWSYGLCIILLTVLVRGLMFPISRKQAVMSAKMQEKMQELAPELKKLKEKFKGDAMGLHQATQELYARKGFNQFAMLGTCWIAFAQMPIFLGLYYALQESIHFRLAPFLWIKNLAAPDMLFWWSEHIPLVSTPENQAGGLLSILYLGPYFSLLPVIAVSLMIVQQKLLTPPATDEQQAMQQKMMSYMMIFFGLMFYKVAAGLCLYFIASSLWGLAERKLFLPKRRLAAAALAAAGRDGGQPGPGRSGARLKPRGPKGNGDGTVQKVRDWWSEVLKEARKK